MGVREGALRPSLRWGGWNGGVPNVTAGSQNLPPSKSSCVSLNLSAVCPSPFTSSCLPLSLLHLQAQVKCSCLFQEAFLIFSPHRGGILFL